jgi:hypothetical protein
MNQVRYHVSIEHVAEQALGLLGPGQVVVQGLLGADASGEAVQVVGSDADLPKGLDGAFSCRVRPQLQRVHAEQGGRGVDESRSRPERRVGGRTERTGVRRVVAPAPLPFGILTRLPPSSRSGWRPPSVCLARRE